MPADESNSEWLTRKWRIDPELDACGWPRRKVPGPGASTQEPGPHRLEEYETDAGPADYALCVDADALGVVETKKSSLGPQKVRFLFEQMLGRGACVSIGNPAVLLERPPTN